MRIDRRTFRALDDLVLSPSGWQQRSPVCTATRVRIGHGPIDRPCFFAIRRRDILQHRAWMTRAYAIGLGAGTQVLTGMVGELIAGPPNELGNALLMGAGWAINLAVAEWSIHKRMVRSARRASVVASHLQ